MRLNKGDKIICILENTNDLTYGKSYEVVNTRNYLTDDICIRGDDGLSWWFEQIKDINSSRLGDIIYAGGWQCWTMWFITEKEWSRDQKINEILSISE